jgi:hypothetical protein
VPNGQTIGRLLGDKYKDDFIPNELGPPRTLPLIPPRVQLSSPEPFPIPLSLVQMEQGAYTQNQNPTTKSSLNMARPTTRIKNNEEENVPSGFKKSYFSKYSPTMEDQGYRAINDIHEQDEASEAKELNRKLQLDVSEVVEDALARSIGDVGEDETDTGGDGLLRYINESQESSPSEVFPGKSYSVQSESLTLGLDDYRRSKRQLWGKID